MNIKIQDINFSTKEELKAFVEKKVNKLGHFMPDLNDATVVLTVTKPESKENKKARITLEVPGPDLFSEKTADSFEEAVTKACEALEPQLARLKDQRSGK